MRLTLAYSKLENVPLVPLVAHVTSANGKVRSPQSAALLTMKVVRFVRFRAVSGAVSFPRKCVIT